MTKPPVPREFRSKVDQAAAHIRDLISQPSDDAKIAEIATTLGKLKAESERFKAHNPPDHANLKRVTGYIASAEESLAQTSTADRRKHIKWLNQAYNSLDHASGVLGILFLLWYGDVSS